MMEKKKSRSLFQSCGNSTSTFQRFGGRICAWDSCYCENHSLGIRSTLSMCPPYFSAILGPFSLVLALCTSLPPGLGNGGFTL